MPVEQQPPVCDYEGSDYQVRFWDHGGREYEDRCEVIALRRLMPKSGHLLLELGAGAGRNTARYRGFERIVLLDYSRSQLRLAQEHLGQDDRYVYVAADIYRLPFVDGLFDGATMIRTLHHMADAPAALRQVRNVIQPGAAFILEYANKRNLKAILRYALRQQAWSPFDRQPVQFVPLNFDFHPKAIRSWLNQASFFIEKSLAVSYFRIGFLKRSIPVNILSGLDSLVQWSGALGAFSPSVFLRAKAMGQTLNRQAPGDVNSFFKCPECGQAPLAITRSKIACPACQRKWRITEGIYDFRGV
jgi:ubiquinone/menaquinone biosynthesis C-methylase UbiE